MKFFEKHKWIAGFLIITILWIAVSTFRYKITGTSQGYIYKTDRLTGKTYLVTPMGEKEIGAPIPASTPESFPLVLLDIISTKSTSYNGAEVELRNNSQKAAKNIVLKITYSKTKNGPTFDTQYSNTNKEIQPGDTVTIPFTLQQTDSWYGVAVYSATY